MTKPIKKALTVALILLLVAAVLTPFLLLWRFFHPHTDNAFDELFYEVWRMEYGMAGKRLRYGDNYANYDLGCFAHLTVAEPRMSLSKDKDSLYFLFFDFAGYNDLGGELHKAVLYRYDVKTKILYGEGPLGRITEVFFSAYFFWCEETQEKSHYTLQNLGDFTYVYADAVHYE